MPKNNTHTAIFEYIEPFKNFRTYLFEGPIDAFLLPYLENGIKKSCKIMDMYFTLVNPKSPSMRVDMFSA